MGGAELFELGFLDRAIHIQQLGAIALDVEPQRFGGDFLPGLIFFTNRLTGFGSGMSRAENTCAENTLPAARNDDRFPSEAALLMNTG
jgi:hypothetical protein